MENAEQTNAEAAEAPAKSEYGTGPDWLSKVPGSKPWANAAPARELVRRLGVAIAKLAEVPACASCGHRPEGEVVIDNARTRGALEAFANVRDSIKLAQELGAEPAVDTKINY